MSEDVAVVEAAPVAEATTDTPVTTTATEAPLSRNDARREAITTARERVFGKETPAQTRDDAGKFTASTEAAKPDSDVGILAETQAPTEPLSIRIELPEGHPLREQGRTFVTVQKDEEMAVRALLNNPVRQRDVETFRQQAITAQQELARKDAVIQALREQRTSAMSDPSVAANYAALFEADPAVAEAYRRGIEQSLEAELGTRQSEVDAQLQEQQGQEAARQFSGESLNHAIQQGIGEWWLKDNYKQEIASFGWRVAQGLANPTKEEAFEHLKAAYFRNPHVINHYASLSAAQQQQHSAQIAESARNAALEQAKADELARLQQAGQRRTTMHPMGTVAGVQAGVRSTAEPVADLSQMGPRELRNHLRTQTLTQARAL